MKTLEIILRLLDELLTAFKIRKAQNERNELEQAPDAWFRNHFGNGMQPKDGEANKTNSSDNTQR